MNLAGEEEKTPAMLAHGRSVHQDQRPEQVGRAQFMHTSMVVLALPRRSCLAKMPTSSATIPMTGRCSSPASCMNSRTGYLGWRPAHDIPLPWSILLYQRSLLRVGAERNYEYDSRRFQLSGSLLPSTPHTDAELNVGDLLLPVYEMVNRPPPREERPRCGSVVPSRSFPSNVSSSGRTVCRTAWGSFR